ncbi:hypothetical protein RQN9TF_11265 [Rhodococcus qingshengii]|uniref:hypothetical protein n=1 Tax=Rhodococcus qingshengii TaxID=334542 RepID=UPI002203D935|nr:hypothetical protein [Rhodococcus qingshengii]BDQ19781.1 hypothetical protein RQN9TF_11265 [Rhodococcus qingshengii]
MTVLTGQIRDVAEFDDQSVFAFQIPEIRGDGNEVVTTRTYFVQAVNGVLTTPDLSPGPATLTVRAKEYQILIPESGSPLPIWPLIDAGMPPPVGQPGFVRNAGGIARIQRTTVANYAAIPSKDPETLYITFES